jgi:predicted O-methyltransferase YrrM
LFDLLAKEAGTIPFADGTVDGLRYRFENGSYGHGDASVLHLMLRDLRPERVIEVGSGFSSACLLDTVDGFLAGRTQCTFVEPYDELLRSLLRPDDLARTEILTSRVQDVPVSRFADLRSGDLLFIDSTHVSKVGSDVNYLFFEVLPSLEPGVVVHLHDIFPAFEYPWEWIDEGRAWSESYLLRAFLQFNRAFEVLLWVPLLYTLDPARVTSAVATVARNPGGSIYLRRVSS